MTQRRERRRLIASKSRPAKAEDEDRKERHHGRKDGHAKQTNKAISERPFDFDVVVNISAQ